MTNTVNKMSISFLTDQGEGLAPQNPPRLPDIHTLFDTHVIDPTRRRHKKQVLTPKHLQDAEYLVTVVYKDSPTPISEALHALKRLYRDLEHLRLHDFKRIMQHLA